MSSLYNRRFKIGASLWIVGFVIGNVASYIGAWRRAERISISFAPYSFPSWGFPFHWDGGLWSIFNVALMLIGALFFGLLFRWITESVK